MNANDKPPGLTPELWGNLVRAVRAFALAVYGDEATGVSIRLLHLGEGVHPLPAPWMFADDPPAPAPTEE